MTQSGILHDILILSIRTRTHATRSTRRTTYAQSLRTLAIMYVTAERLVMNESTNTHGALVNDAAAVSLTTIIPRHTVVSTMIANRGEKVAHARTRR